MPKTLTITPEEKGELTYQELVGYLSNDIDFSELDTDSRLLGIPYSAWVVGVLAVGGFCTTCFIISLFL
ncbi:hypothetical protein [Fibrella forsythiae]|uniref:Uncharacterized protein n=1 Tax=Fibrella forsythiae TaxID=2817061 RepID=A0ABS3JC40_9BACT|nr:hypothetical protein [Fibrella forsythiae]MBO0947559.1 hypothetical protein [Fibrella forsythiae]